jgi:succinate dehydrogenase/fumarate reductase flavoprotein subunit
MITKKLYFNYKDSTVTVHINWVHTLVIGSGAAGLNAALQLYRNGVQDILILTEGLDKGTSINTGSDKQTYYKLSMCGSDSDSPMAMAESYLRGGAMHGDLALIEASLSARAFINLVNMGVPFPRDRYGQFVGYKTDHDPAQRATSIGPYTSREMCRRLIAEINQLGIPVLENRYVIQMVRSDTPDTKRIVAALVMGKDNALEAYAAENIIFATGGPGGLYKTSVYPQVHTGAIGLALLAGAEARSLPESQYGLASIQFRWNVSGTYMQVIPRFISRAADGISDEREFLPDYFKSASELNGKVFLKGYQWPFDAQKAIGGSSIVDILVYIETVQKGRRVYLDFRQNPQSFQLEELPEEARSYLVRSEAIQDKPIERLNKMNPGAIDLYKENGIDLYHEPLEIAVCAQHNNGGLAGNIWWESTNIKHFFPVGEVNGSHGVNRPGGTALNSGQVGGFRAAEYIAACYQGWTVEKEPAEEAVLNSCKQALMWIESGKNEPLHWQEALEDLQMRMSRAGAHIRSPETLASELPDARQLVEQLLSLGCRSSGQEDLVNIFRVRQLAVAHLVYLEAIKFMLDNQVGSRGSSIVLDSNGTKVHDQIDDGWKIQPENQVFRKKVLKTILHEDGSISHIWEEVRLVPEIDAWFETQWAAFRKKEIYDCE